MKFETQSALLASIISFFLAISYGLKIRQHNILLSFTILNITIFIWNLGLFLNKVTGIGISVYFLGYFFIPSIFLFFTIEITRFKKNWSKKLLHYSLIGAFVCYIFFIILYYKFPSLIISILDKRFRDVFSNSYLIFLHFISILYFFPLLFLSLFLMIKKRKETPFLIERIKLNYLILGGIIIILPGFLNSILNFGELFISINRLLSAIYLYYISQIIFKYPLSGLYELVEKGIVFFILTIIMVVIFLILILGVGNNPTLFIINTVISSIVIIILYEPIKLKIEDLTTKFFFKRRYELQNILQELSKSMLNVITIEELLQLVIKYLSQCRQILSTSIYLIDENSNSLKLATYLGYKEKDIPAKEIELNDLFYHYLLEISFNPIFLEHIKLQTNDNINRQDSKLEVILDILNKMNTDLSIPLISQGKLIGVWNFIYEKSFESYTNIEVNLLLTISNQFVIGIQKCNIYEKMRQKDKLAALGEMMSILAHEIRNPLGAVKGAAQYLQPILKDKEVEEFLNIIIDETNRLNNVVSQFLDYAKPYRLTLDYYSINDIVNNTLSTIFPNKLANNIEIITNLSDNIPKLLVDGEKIKQVLLNLIINAIQAMPSGGKIYIKTAKGKLFKGYEIECVDIEIKDQGVGINPSDLPKIFNPFFTTKAKGTGLGLAICQKIIDEHKGKIEVISELNLGSSFIVKLPI